RSERSGTPPSVAARSTAQGTSPDVAASTPASGSAAIDAAEFSYLVECHRRLRAAAPHRSPARRNSSRTEPTGGHQAGARRALAGGPRSEPPARSQKKQELEGLAAVFPGLRASGLRELRRPPVQCPGCLGRRSP